MFTIAKTFAFESSHCLELHDGKCKNLHGHSYKFTLILSGPIQKCGPKTGMVMDYYNVNEAGLKIVSRLDHMHLNEVMASFQPTAEGIAQWIYYLLKPELPLLSCVEVKETDNTWARYQPDINPLNGKGVSYDIFESE